MNHTDKGSKEKNNNTNISNINIRNTNISKMNIRNTNISNTNTDKPEISAICFSSLPLINFGDKRAVFFGISLKTTAKAVISEKTGKNKIEIYGCSNNKLKNAIKILIVQIFKKFKFPYKIKIQISTENKNDKFSIFSAAAIAAYGVVASKYGIIYDETMEKELRENKFTKRKLIKMHKKIYTYKEIFADILALINSMNSTNLDIGSINYIQAYSSYFGGIVVGKANEIDKSDSKYEILRYAENEKLDVVLIPKGKEKEKVINTNNMKHMSDIIWDEILRGNFYTAANLECVLQSFKRNCKFHKIVESLIDNALYCGLTDNYIFGVFRGKNSESISKELKNLRVGKFKENLIIAATNNSPAGIY